MDEFVRRFLVRSKTGPLSMCGSTTFMYIGSFERGVGDVLECLFNFLGRGLFVDVGAYVGFYSVFAAGERTDVADLTLGVVPSWSSLTSYTPLIILQCLFRML